MVLDSCIEATESSSKMAIDCNRNLDAQLILNPPNLGHCHLESDPALLARSCYSKGLQHFLFN